MPLWLRLPVRHCSRVNAANSFGVLKICHRIVLTPTLTVEWNEHQSQFARTWRAEMLSLGKVVNIEESPNERVRNQVPKRKAVQKDLHLVEAAIATDTW